MGFVFTGPFLVILGVKAGPHLPEIRLGGFGFGLFRLGGLDFPSLLYRVRLTSSGSELCFGGDTVLIRGVK